MDLIKKPNRPVSSRVSKFICASLAALFPALQVAKATGSLVEFSFSLNSHDPIVEYTDVSAGEAPVDTQLVVGFDLEISAIDGVEQSIGSFAAFCSEIAVSISPNQTYEFIARPLRNLAIGTAGNSGTASAAMSPGVGIGDLAAARIKWLFDTYYPVSGLITDFINTDLDPTVQAFQLAIWEISHDGDLSLSDTTGSFFVGDQIAGDDLNRRTNAITTAQDMLDSLENATVDETYTSQIFDFWALTDGSAQDLVLAIAKDDPSGGLITVPEARHFGMLAGIAALGFCGVRRRQCRR